MKPLKTLKNRIIRGYIIGFILTLVLIVVLFYRQPLERLVGKTFLEILVCIISLIVIVLFGGRSGGGLIDAWEVKRESLKGAHVYKNGKELKKDEKGNILKSKK
ncbi:MAG: hypothetical protein J6V98_05130 [Bacteroidales bacterium]|nr:hypothetical protein [Bacteroidales bacterium]